MNDIDQTLLELKRRIDFLEKQIRLTSQKESKEFLTMNEMQKRHIQAALARTQNVVSGEKGAARLLGMNPKTLWSRMKRLEMNLLKGSRENKG